MAPFGYNAPMTFSDLFFDLDATLYPASSGLWKVIKSRIEGYMIRRLGFSEEETLRLRKEYYQRYGTTLTGLTKHHDVDPEDYLHYVHDIPLQDYIQYNPRLREILASLSQKKWVFTNSDHQHAERVLDILRIKDLFQGILDIYALDFHVKPSPEAYQQALLLAHSPSPADCVLFDDLIQNIFPAQKIGFYTVLVGENGSPRTADLHLRSILELPDQMPSLWRT